MLSNLFKLLCRYSADTSKVVWIGQPPAPLVNSGGHQKRILNINIFLQIAFLPRQSGKPISFHTCALKLAKELTLGSIHALFNGLTMKSHLWAAICVCLVLRQKIDIVEYQAIPREVSLRFSEQGLGGISFLWTGPVYNFRTKNKIWEE